MCLVFFSNTGSRTPVQSVENRTLTPQLAPPKLIKVKVPVTVYASNEKFVDAWKDAPETCEQWIAIQRETGSYLDAYVVGSQKGATSELSKNLFNLGVRPRDMIKEWHFFNRLDYTGQLTGARTVAQPLPPIQLTHLRLMHYQTGFPGSFVTTEPLPLVDRSSIDNRKLILDMTVEYLHSDRTAFLAHVLTPHAKVIITIRNPLERALSQYNMNIRNGNKIRRKMGMKDRPASAEEFDKKVRMEIYKLNRCGYSSEAATLDRTTSQLVACMFNNSREERFDDSLYVFRGLYHLHIRTWRDHFPSHRILIISFQDFALGRRQMYEDVSKFLCVRPFPDDMLQRFEHGGSMLSFGQQAVQKGLDKGGFDSYVGNDRYLAEMMEETQDTLMEFYSAANKQLRSLVGAHYVYWS